MGWDRILEYMRCHAMSLCDVPMHYKYCKLQKCITKYYKILLYYTVVQRNTPYHKILPRSTKNYSGPYYKGPLRTTKDYSVLQIVLLGNTKYHSVLRSTTPYSILQSITPYTPYYILHSTTAYNKVLLHTLKYKRIYNEPQRITPYCKVLLCTTSTSTYYGAVLRTKKYYSVLQSTTMQSTTPYYKVWLRTTE